MTGTLATISKAKAALLSARTLKEVLDIRDNAEGWRVVMRARGESLQTQNLGAEMKLRAERKAGHMLPQLDLRTGFHRGTLVLEEFGIDKKESHRWQREASVPEEDFERLIATCNADEIELTQASLLRLAGAGHVSQSTGENEWYTPAEYIDLAREVMGAIDLDPASSDGAQRIVKAETYFTLADDGLNQPWAGRVWLNPPYARDLVTRFAQKLVSHYDAGDIPQAVVLTNNATETEWFQLLARQCRAVCFPSGRIRFSDKQGKPVNAPLQGQVFFYFGQPRDQARFIKKFSPIGVVFRATGKGAA